MGLGDGKRKGCDDNKGGNEKEDGNKGREKVGGGFWVC